MIRGRCRDLIPVNPFVIALVTQAVFSSELIFSSMNFCNEKEKEKRRSLEFAKAAIGCKIVTSISDPHNDTQVLMRLYARQDNTCCLKQDNNHFTHNQHNNFKSGGDRTIKDGTVHCIQT